MRTITCLTWLAALAAVLLLASCAPHTQAPPMTAINSPDISKMSPSQALQTMRQGRSELHSLSAYFELSITPPPKRGFSSLRGALLMDMAGSMPRARITAFGPFGSTLFDMVRSADSVQVYVPSQSTLYQGRLDANATRNSTAGEPNPMNTVFSSVLRDPLAMQADDLQSITAIGDAWRIPLQDGALFVDRNTGFATAYEDSDVRLEFADYIQPAGGPPMPSRIRMRSNKQNLAASFRLEDVEANPDLANAFDLSSYAPEKTRPIEELERQ